MDIYFWLNFAQWLAELLSNLAVCVGALALAVIAFKFTTNSNKK